MNTIDNEDLKKFGCHQKSTNDIGIDMIDICSLTGKVGKISGYSNIVEIDNFVEDIVNNINQSDFKNSKSMLMMFSLNDNYDLQEIKEAIDKLNTMVPDECKTIFGIDITTELDEKSIGYRILLAGIE